MSFEQFLQIVEKVLSSPKAHALALSIGGWEGWLQCEIWNLVSEAGQSIERELKYPGYNQYCDLVCELDQQASWIELKAFGQFQQTRTDSFFDSFANDVLKLQGAPNGVARLALLVVPRNIGDVLIEKIAKRWSGIKSDKSEKAILFFLRF